MRCKCNFSNNNNILHWRNRLSFTKMHSHNALISQMTVLRLRTVKWIPEGPQTGAALWLPSYSSTSSIIADLKPQVPVQLQDAARQVRPSSRCWKDGPLKRPLRGRAVSSAQSSLGAAKRINLPTVIWEGSGGNLRRRDSERKEGTDMTEHLFHARHVHGQFLTASLKPVLNLLDVGGSHTPLRISRKLWILFPRQRYIILHTSTRESRW